MISLTRLAVGVVLLSVLVVAQAQDKCSGLFVQTSTGGSLQFPSNGNYENNMLCSWTVGTDQPNMYIDMSLQWKDIELGASCNYDWLLIKSPADIGLERICATSYNPESFTFPYNQIVLVFTSDKSNVGRGFSFNFTFVPASTLDTITETPTPDKCAATVIQNSKGGTLQYPPSGEYQDDVYCIWNIGTNQPDMYIQLVLQWSDIQYCVGCGCDALEVRLPSNTLLQNFCGFSNTPESIVLPYDNVSLVFRTDDIFTGRGFNVTYVFTPADELKTTVPYKCGSSFNQTADGGSLLFPSSGNYDNNAFCTWDIGNSQTGTYVSLTIQRKDIEYVGSCMYDWLAVSTKSGLQLQKLCGRSNDSETFTFPYSELRLEFRSDSVIVGTGFYLNFTFAPGGTADSITQTRSGDKCDASDVPDPQGGTLQFPFSGQYQNSVYCAWSISSDLINTWTTIVLQWKSIENCAACSCDALEIRLPNNTLLEDICGSSDTPETFVLPYRDLQLVFRSDVTVVGSGFNVTYTFTSATTPNPSDKTPAATTQFIPQTTAVDPCASVFDQTGNSGSLLFPASGTYANDISCSWTIGPSLPGTRIAVTIQWKDIQSSVSCVLDSLTIKMANGTALRSICGRSNVTQTFVYNRNRIQLVFTSDESVVGKGFYLTFNYTTGNTTTQLPITTAAATVTARTAPQEYQSTGAAESIQPTQQGYHATSFPRTLESDGVAAIGGSVAAAVIVIAIVASMLVFALAIRPRMQRRQSERRLLLHEDSSFEAKHAKVMSNPVYG